MNKEYKKSNQRLAVCESQWAKKIQASSVPAELQLIPDGDPMLIEAADQGDNKGKLRTFKMRAYSGGPMVIGGWPYPVVVELTGMKVRNQTMPILRGHDQEQVIGHTSEIIVGQNSVDLRGEISGTGPAAKEVVESADNGFPWQASIGLRVEQVLMVAEGESIQVNGKTWKGPLYATKKSVLKEVSIVAVGADDNTAVRIAATAGTQTKEVLTMEFEKWLQAKGQDLATLSEEQIASLKAEYEAEIAAAAVSKSEPKKDPEVKPAVNPAIATQRAEMAAEAERVNGIRTVCASGHGTIEVQAIADGWSVDKTELAVLRAIRPKAPAAHIKEDGVDGTTLEAIGCVNGGLPESKLLKAYGEKAVEAAYKYRGLGIQDFFRLAAATEGRILPRNVGSGGDFIRAAFSTISLPGILGAVANKMMLDGYDYVESSWRQVCKIGSVKNFQLHTRYRMTEDFKFEKVGPDGELKHGQVGQQTYTNQVDTHGKLFSLTRQAIINDDMGAFASIPQRLGIGAAEAICDAVWTLLLSNPSSFFAAASGNYDDGTDTVLSIGGLTLAEVLFLTQTKPNGRPLGIVPSVLLVPPALKVTAEQLMKSTTLNENTTITGGAVGSTNPHAGKYSIAVSAYLQNATISGASSTGWYLFADPNRLAALEVAFLNGIDRPTVEQAEADFNTLGIQFRGFVDFGVKEQDYRGALFMKGAT